MELVDEVNDAIEEGKCSSAMDFFLGIGHTYDQAMQKSNSYYKWNKESTYKAALRDIVGLGRKNSKQKFVNRKSPFQELESKLYNEFRGMRSKSKKVSSRFIRINALKIYDELREKHPETWGKKQFHASYGWMRRFMSRKKIKYRKRKCGKEKTAQEFIPEFEAFLARLRFDFLKPIQHESNPSIWGRFPPEKRYNMDQVPLPFVVGQDYTFTQHDDRDVNIKCPDERLRKRQFTMHIVVNAGKDKKKHGWVDLVCKGTGKRIKQAEKELWNTNVDVYWQKNAWVDTTVMEQIAQKFVCHKNKIHGKEEWVILFCDNLRAHVAHSVKSIFGENKILLCYFPPGCTNFIQPIDAGYGRSLRTAVSNSLDEWLMESENLQKWEGKMSASERRILTTNLVGKANKTVMSDEMDKMRIGCFERTGMLLTHIINSDFDKKICPQGMKAGEFHIPTMLNDESVPESVNAMADVDEYNSGRNEEEIVINEEYNDDDSIIDDE